MRTQKGTKISQTQDEFMLLLLGGLENIYTYQTTLSAQTLSPWGEGKKLETCFQLLCHSDLFSNYQNKWAYIKLVLANQLYCISP